MHICIEMELILHSPVGAEPISFIWLTPDLNNLNKNVANDIIDTVRLVFEDKPTLKYIFNKNMLDKINRTNFTHIKNICDRFNKIIDMLVKLEKRKCEMLRPSKKLLKHILHQTYKRAVKCPISLNQYKCFSPEVYGETSFDFISKMIDQIKITSNDVFLDLGSGIGQIVLQMAAATTCKICYGIERANIPSEYAESMSKVFQSWLQWFGKISGEYKLIKADFLEDTYLEIINKSTVIFVNNFAFGPIIDCKLKQRFAELKDGTRIISPISFCPLNFRLSGRNINDIGAIMQISKLPTLKGSVSWTDKPISFYLHEIDRSKLEIFFQRFESSKKPVNYRARKRSKTSSQNQQRLKMIEKIPTTVENDDTVYSDAKGLRHASQSRINSSEEQLLSSRLSEEPINILTCCNSLLETYRKQFMEVFNNKYKDIIKPKIPNEKAKNILLQNQISELEKCNAKLTENNVSLLKTRMSEIGINVTTSDEFIAQAKEDVSRHKKLQKQGSLLQREVTDLEETRKLMLDLIRKDLNIKVNMTEEEIKEFIIYEMSSLFAQKKKLLMEISCIEKEVVFV